MTKSSLPGATANGNNERNNISFGLEKSSLVWVGDQRNGKLQDLTPKQRKAWLGLLSVPGLLEEVKQWAHIGKTC